jgi:hypothetical protein
MRCPLGLMQHCSIQIVVSRLLHNVRHEVSRCKASKDHIAHQILQYIRHQLMSSATWRQYNEIICLGMNVVVRLPTVSLRSNKLICYDILTTVSPTMTEPAANERWPLPVKSSLTCLHSVAGRLMRSPPMNILDARSECLEAGVRFLVL